jgi:hypothetical protein
MSVAGQGGTFGQAKLGHEGPVAMNQGFSLNSLQGRQVTGSILWLEHAP